MLRYMIHMYYISIATNPYLLQRRPYYLACNMNVCRFLSVQILRELQYVKKKPGYEQDRIQSSLEIQALQEIQNTCIH